MSDVLNISQIDVKKKDGTDITGQEELNYRNFAKKYLDRQRVQLTSVEYKNLEQKIKVFLEGVDVDMQELNIKFDTLRSDAVNIAKGERTALRGDAEITKAKSSAEFILTSISATNKELTKRVEILTKKEYDTGLSGYMNFISPENMMGLSTRLMNGNTVTGMKLQALKSFSERSGGTEKQLKTVIQKLDEGMSMTEVKTIPSLQSFFASPEGKYLIDIMTGRPEEANQKYILNMARLYKQMDCPLDAELYYDKLDKTPLENVAKAERMSKMERFQRKGLTSFANDFLSLDQLAIMAAGGAIGRGAGWVVGKSTTLSKAAVVTGKAIEGSKIAKVLLPGVQVLKSGAGENIVMSIGKGLGNIAFDTAKFIAYSSAAEAIGGEDAGKAVRLALAVIPGAKAGFETQMGVNVAKDAGKAGKLADWMIKKYGPQETEQMIYQGLVKEAEAKAMSSGKLFRGLSKEVTDGFTVTAKTTTSQLEKLASKSSNIEKSIFPAGQPSISTPKKVVGEIITLDKLHDIKHIPEGTVLNVDVPGATHISGNPLYGASKIKLKSLGNGKVKILDINKRIDKGAPQNINICLKKGEEYTIGYSSGGSRDYLSFLDSNGYGREDIYIKGVNSIKIFHPRTHGPAVSVKNITTGGPKVGVEEVQPLESITLTKDLNLYPGKRVDFTSKQGKMIKGKIVSVEDNSVVFKPDKGGKFKVGEDNLRKFRRIHPLDEIGAEMTMTQKEIFKELEKIENFRNLSRVSKAELDMKLLLGENTGFIDELGRLKVDITGTPISKLVRKNEELLKKGRKIADDLYTDTSTVSVKLNGGKIGSKIKTSGELRISPNMVEAENNIGAKLTSEQKIKLAMGQHQEVLQELNTQGKLNKDIGRLIGKHRKAWTGAKGTNILTDRYAQYTVPEKVTPEEAKSWLKNNWGKLGLGIGALIAIGGATYMVVKDKDGNIDVVTASSSQDTTPPVTPPEGQSETLSPEGGTPEQKESSEDSTEPTQPTPKPGKKSSGGTSEPKGGEGVHAPLTPEQIKEGAIGTVETKEGRLNVRDENGKVIGKLNKGEQVTLTGDTKDINGRKYIKVKSSGGKEGFVAMDFIKMDTGTNTQEQASGIDAKIQSLKDKVSTVENKTGELLKDNQALLEAGKSVEVGVYTITQGKMLGQDWYSDDSGIPKTEEEIKKAGREAFSGKIELVKKDGKYILEMTRTGVFGFGNYTKELTDKMPTKGELEKAIEDMRVAKQKDGLENYAKTTHIYEVSTEIKKDI